MPRPIEPMLARWPMLYPEIAGADVENDSFNEAARVRREVVAPLLEATDVHGAFEEAMVEYGRWRDSTLAGEGELEAVVALEEEKEDALEAAFEEHRRTLGEQSVRALQQVVLLRRIARGSIPERESWPEEAWRRIGCLMTTADLCIAGILEYLATGTGNRNNMDILVRRAFDNALDAYWDAGYHSQEANRRVTWRP